MIETLDERLRIDDTNGLQVPSGRYCRDLIDGDFDNVFSEFDQTLIYLMQAGF